MGSREDYAVLHMIMRCIRILGQALPEGKQEQPHARKAETADDLSNIGSNEPQVLGYHGQVGKAPEESIEKVLCRNLDPLSNDCRLLSGPDLPVGDKTPKMIYSDDVE